MKTEIENNSGKVVSLKIFFTKDDVQLIRNSFADIYQMAFINNVKLIGVQKVINMLETKLGYEEKSTF